MKLPLFKNSGYRTRLLLAILLVSLPLFVLSEIDGWMVMQRFAYNLLIDRVNSASAFLVHQIENKLTSASPSVVPEIGNLPNVTWATILDDEGAVQYSTKPEWMGKKYPVKDLEDFQEFKTGLIIRSVDLKIFEKSWKLQFGYSTRKIIDDLHHSLYRALVFDGAICFMVLLFAWIMAGFLHKPLAELKKNTLKMAHGDFSVKMNVSSNNIIGELATAFNTMARDVHDLTDNLEEKIKSATRQLTSKNQELEASNAKLKELDKFRSDFLAMLSHDIKGPLASIIGFAQTLEKNDLPEEKKRRYLRIIETEGKQLTSLVGGILDISKMESNTFPLKFESISLPELLAESLNGFQQQSSMEIEKHVPADLSLIWGDKNMLSRAVGNILDNAKKYCDDRGKIEITAAETDGRIHISIPDSGPGIPKEDREKVFDKFYRSRNAIAHKKKGSGLGLAIVKAVIDAHSGSVWCESGPGKGTTIGFCLPKSRLLDGPSANGETTSDIKATSVLA